MAQLTRDQIAPIAERFGAKVPGLKEELEAKMQDDLASVPRASAYRIVTEALPRGLVEVMAAEAQALPVEEAVQVAEAIDERQVVSERIVAVGLGARPVARVRNNQATTEFLGPASLVWSAVITAAKARIDAAIPAVGRIELNDADLPWAGTGWLVADGIIVTNRHVARAFARRDTGCPGRFVFKPGLLGPRITADIDFLEEENNLDSAEHPITAVLWIAPEDEADVAFLKVTAAQRGPALPPHIKLATSIDPDATIVAIGYPARDPTIRDQALVVRVFGDDVYEKKRLSPGKLLSVGEDLLRHDCSTLGGNSGSVLLDLASGEAIGLHQGGLLDDSANLGVPAIHVDKLLKQALLAVKPETPPAPVAPAPPAPSPAGAVTRLPAPEGEPARAPGSYRFVVNVPIEIIVNVGTPGVGVAGPAPPGVVPINAFDAALKAATSLLTGRPGVIDVRAGYRFKNGWITDERVIVVEVAQKLEQEAMRAAALDPIPREIGGIGVDVRTAALPTQLDALGVDLTALERPATPGAYREPAGYDDPNSNMFLGPVKEKMTATFHVSPDAGFKNLKAFLGRVTGALTATMYEWGEGNHITEAIEQAIHPANRTLRMVTQKNGVGGSDATESAVADMKAHLGGKFKHVFASVVGSRRLIPGSYHIKVASRDGEEMWLSSGNWKDSNQPENPRLPAALKSNNREWHVVVRNDKLAQLFQRYIEYDFQQAKRFPNEEREAPAIADIELFVPELVFGLALEAPAAIPAPTYNAELTLTDKLLDIQPLLTPDRDARGARMFLKAATDMVRRASKRVYVQNQSFNLTDDNNEEFDEFFEVLRDRQRSIPDVRVILRDARDYGRADDLADQQKLIERLKKFGIDTSRERLRVQPKCHTKGIIVDSEQVLLGSQNLTNGGSLFNRDASLLVRSSTVAKFFEKIFLFDWEFLAHNSVDERVGGVRRARPGEETPAGFRRVRLSTLLADD